MEQSVDIGDFYAEMASPLDDAMEQVSDLLEAQHVRDHGPIKPDAEALHELIGRRTGYIVGVQVGLRLRSARQR
jgi:hypothetical protein